MQPDGWLVICVWSIYFSRYYNFIIRAQIDVLHLFVGLACLFVLKAENNRHLTFTNS
ncbi:MAG TPA: hypothetical protein VNL15_05085 [Dehalococcoidia bacterium]|nr:hypothetical protein [Dehalococcoidia bacterium]